MSFSECSCNDLACSTSNGAAYTSPPNKNWNKSSFVLLTGSGTLAPSKEEEEEEDGYDDDEEEAVFQQLGCPANRAKLVASLRWMASCSTQNARRCANVRLPFLAATMYG